MYEEKEIKYLKKKYGNISKANKKSDHKHEYDKKVVFEYQGNGALDSIWHIGVSYCSVCGKIGDQIESNFLQSYKKTKEEWLEKYPDVIFVKLERGKHWYDVSNINEVI